MKQIINFIDVDVDGCGTNVETMIQIEGDQAEPLKESRMSLKDIKKRIMANTALMMLLKLHASS